MMNHLLTITLLLALLRPSFGQTIPQPVLDKLADRFGAVESPEWIETAHDWVADFVFNGKFTSVTFDESGKIISILTSVEQEDLNSAITGAILKNYPGSSYGSIDMEEDAKGDILYLVNVYHEDSYYLIKITGAGKITEEQEQQFDDE